MRIKPAGQLPFKQDKVLAVAKYGTDEDYPKAGGQVSVTGGSSTTGVGVLFQLLEAQLNKASEALFS